jgi:hypothetical protein
LACPEFGALIVGGFSKETWQTFVSRAWNLPGSELREPSSTVLRGQLDDTEREVAKATGIPRSPAELKFK